MARFVNAQVPEVVQPFWAALQRGEFITDAAVQVGHVSQAGHALGGGLRRRAPAPRARPEGALPVVFRAGGDRARTRARGDDRRDRAAPGSVAVDDLARAAPQRRPRRRLPGDDRRTRSPMSARAAPSRPSSRSTWRCASWCRTICCRRYSPEQIAGRLRRQFPDDPEMWVSAETIYQSLYVQSQGRAAARADPLLAHRPRAAPARPPRRPAQEPHRARHGQHRRAPARGRRSRGARPLGGRSA